MIRGGYEAEGAEMRKGQVGDKVDHRRGEVCAFDAQLHLDQLGKEYGVVGGKCREKGGQGLAEARGECNTEFAPSMGGLQHVQELRGGVQATSEAMMGIIEVGKIRV